jgi:hypothetical protein
VTKPGFLLVNELKFTYEHLQYQHFFRLASARHKGDNRIDGRDGKGRDREREERGGKRKGEREGEAGS